MDAHSAAAYWLVQITPVPSTNKLFLYYESSDAEVAEEYEGGVIKAIALGICTIEVMDIVSKKTVTFTVVVEDDSEEVAGLKTQLSEQVKASKAVKVSSPCGTVKYTLAGVSKAKFKKYFKVDPKSGGLTVKKGLKKGAYTVKIKVSASGDDDHLPTAKTASVKVKVK